MDERAFDALVQRMAQLRLARQTAVRGVAASALAGVIAVALPDESPAKDRGKRSSGKRGSGKRGSGKHGSGKHGKHARDVPHNTSRTGKAHDAGTDKTGKRQVRAEAKKNLCQCQGTSRDQCNATACVGCTFQEHIGRKVRRKIKKAYPFSFVVTTASECPAPTTTTSTTAAPTTTSTTTSTTPRPPRTTTTTAPPPTCPAGQVELSNGTCALPCSGSTQCPEGCGGCQPSATGNLCRDAAGPQGRCATDNDCLQGQFCATTPSGGFCTGACSGIG